MTGTADDPSSVLEEALEGRYRDLEEVGRGGMAIVYRARDVVRDRPVAIKILREELGEVIGPDRFLREIEVESQLQHPNILPVFDSGSAGRRPFYVMPFVEGGSLRDRLRQEHQLPVDEAVRITLEIADALSHAHGHGVVHRDVKPENILFSGGHAVLADFGIARAVTAVGGKALTDSGIAVGTPPYMSPEQIAADPQLDGRSDLYSLGVVLFEMLAGDPPFSGSTAQAVLARILAEDPPSLEIVRPNLPSGLLDTIERCLAKVPADRFRTVLDLERALGRAVSTKPRRARRRRVLWAGLSVLAAVGAAAGYLFVGLPRPPELDPQKVVVLPLSVHGLGTEDPEVGEQVALAMLRGLEHAPLTPLDGWHWLSDAQRTRVAGVSGRALRELARSRHAQFYLSGRVAVDGDSLAVHLRLVDAGGDTVVAQASAAAPLVHASASLLGLSALRRILPRLLDPGHDVEIGQLGQRQSAAVAQWLHGERQYRLSHFGPALESFQRALALDSNLAIAAVKGAQAAAWKNRYRDAEVLAAVAIERDSLLPPHYGGLARSLQLYLRGEADSAVEVLTSLVADRPDWPDAHAALGEVLYHLLPTTPDAELQAMRHFRAALAADTTFTPGLMHLIEHALRSGHPDSADQLLSRYARYEPDSTLLLPLQLMVACERGQSVPWQAHAATAPFTVWHAAYVLGGTAARPRCAEQALLALLRSRAASNGTRWGALITLQGILLATGRADEAAAFLDSAASAGRSTALVYLVLETIAGAPWEERARAMDEFISTVFDDDLTRIRQGRDLWVLGVWYAYQGDTTRLKVAQSVLLRKAETEDRRRNLMFAVALRGHLSLARADTTGAIAQFEQLAPVGPREFFSSRYADPLPVEHLVLSRLLAATGRWRDAIDVASRLDHPMPIVYLPFVEPSLRVRRAAAGELGDRALERALNERLSALEGSHH